jgi:hypothetical protein
MLNLEYKAFTNDGTPDNKRHADSDEYGCRSHILGLAGQRVFFIPDPVHYRFKGGVQKFNNQDQKPDTNEQCLLNKGFPDEKPGRDDKDQNKGFLPESLFIGPGRPDSLEGEPGGVDQPLNPFIVLIFHFFPLGLKRFFVKGRPKISKLQPFKYGETVKIWPGS